MPARFSFLPPDLFLAPHGIFWEEEVVFFLAGKNVGICDFRQKKPSDFGEDLFLEITCFWPEKTLKFWPEKAFGNRLKPLPPRF